MKRLIYIFMAFVFSISMNAQIVQMYKNGNFVCKYNTNEIDSIVVKETKCHEWVDLGLPSGTLWATCNIGANQPEEGGLYFAWGETIGYTSDTSDGHLFNWTNYKWMSTGHSSGEYCAKYTFDDGYTSANWYYNDTYVGTKVDGIIYKDKTSLDPEDDAATVNWGNGWRIPTATEFMELKEYCTWNQIDLNGMSGYKVSSNVDGFQDKYIFLPKSGYRSEDQHTFPGGESRYWSSELSKTSSMRAQIVDVYGGGIQCMTSDHRYRGCSIRPVRQK